MKKIAFLLFVSMALLSCEEDTKEEKLEIMEHYLPEQATDVEILKYNKGSKWCYFTLDGKRFLFMKDGHGRAMTEISE